MSSLSLFFLGFMSLLAGEAKSFTQLGPHTSFEADKGAWTKVEVPNTFCGNGSQYKFFVSPVRSSNNVTFIFEPGGACWDYNSCSGRTRGAANPNGIDDNHMSVLRGISLHSPFVFKWNPISQVEPAHWNRVYFPYCTGDVHSGNRVSVYKDPTGVEPDLIWRHVGHHNLLTIIPWLRERFANIEKMFVTGCSAGGAGSTLNYHFLRSRLAPDEGYLLNDSGPIYSATNDDPSVSVHKKIQSSWAADTVMTAIGAEINGIDLDDFGSINTALAEHYTQDRFGHTQFTRDQIYSAYSYESFSQPPPTLEKMLEYWKVEQKKLAGIYEEHANMGYFIPYDRKLNGSHCTTVVSFMGTGIPGSGNVGSFIKKLLDRSQPVPKHLREAPLAHEDGYVPDIK